MKLLDLFCGAGGAAMGYSRAGFDQIVGVDVELQREYPFTFIRGDATRPPVDLGAFDLIHASPPCQAFTTMGNVRVGGKPRWPALIEPTHNLLVASGRPYVIENVSGARSSLVNPIELTGEMFGLRVHRPRLFELGDWYALTPPRPRLQANPIAVYGQPNGRRLITHADGSMLHAWSSLEQGREAMGMLWVTEELGIREAIPPAYTQWLGEQFLQQVAA